MRPQTKNEKTIVKYRVDLYFKETGVYFASIVVGAYLRHSFKEHFTGEAEVKKRIVNELKEIIFCRYNNGYVDRPLKSGSMCCRAMRHCDVDVPVDGITYATFPIEARGHARHRLKPEKRSSAQFVDIRDMVSIEEFDISITLLNRYSVD